MTWLFKGEERQFHEILMLIRPHAVPRAVPIFMEVQSGVGLSSMTDASNVDGTSGEAAIQWGRGLMEEEA